jgi:hypothetical protein
MYTEKANKYPNMSKLYVAYTGICFLLVLKILRGFAVRSPVGKSFDIASE